MAKERKSALTQQPDGSVTDETGKVVGYAKGREPQAQTAPEGSAMGTGADAPAKTAAKAK